MDLSNNNRFLVIGKDGLHEFDSKIEADIYLKQMECESKAEAAIWFAEQDAKYNRKTTIGLVVVFIVLIFILFIIIKLNN